MAVKKITEKQFEEAQQEVVEAQKKLADIDSKRKKDVAKITEKYQGEITEAETKKADAETVIQEYCKQNDKVLFSDKQKSRSVGFGMIFKRKNPPSLVLADGVKDWNVVAANIKKARKGKTYLIVTETVDKQKLMSVRTNKGSDAMFKKFGVKVDQGSKYSFKPSELK